MSCVVLLLLMHQYPLLLTLSWPRTCRYLPGDKLLQHVDGVQIDASIVIGLPTDKQWEGGGLTVWDGKPERQQFDYSMPPGSACFLDRMVWHQANPVTNLLPFGWCPPAGGGDPIAEVEPIHSDMRGARRETRRGMS